MSHLCGETLGDDRVIAVVAVGGYGRGELSPHSDIDLLLLPARARTVTTETLRPLLYPLWDAGFQVGHAVLSGKEAIARAGDDLQAATALLSARLVWGCHDTFGDLIERRTRMLAKHRRVLARRIIETAEARRFRAERVGWTLAPDIKKDSGGLRDIHTTSWLEAVGAASPPEKNMKEAHGTLMAVREALHGVVPRRSDRLRLDLQTPIAKLLGEDDENGRDVLMSAVHDAGRTIEHLSRLLVEQHHTSIFAGPRRSGSVKTAGDGIWVEDSRIRTRRAPVDIEEALEVVAVVAQEGKLTDSAATQHLVDAFASANAGTWTARARDAFVRILGGTHPVTALELLDHVGAWRSLMPEWDGIRALAQHDPYHRYTVDGHSFRAVAALSTFARGLHAMDGSTARSRPLLVAALLHDIGKGSGRDHSIVGAETAAKVADRMGLPDTETEQVVTLVRHHLLLSDTATRRDIDDGAVVEAVVAAVKDRDVLDMLYLLSGADGIATGPDAWTPWKASLVERLYQRVALALETGSIPQRNDVTARLREIEAYDPLISGIAAGVLETMPPSYLSATSIPDIVEDIHLLRSVPIPGRVVSRIDDATQQEQKVITACFRDEPGSLARTAGVLTLHRVSVLSAAAYSTKTGAALERFVVSAPDTVDWTVVETDLSDAFSGRLALEARLARKVADYRTKAHLDVDIRALPEESRHSTVIEVRAPDALGLLYAVCSAIADLGLNIHVAKIDTLGSRVVDVFYLRTGGGDKLDERQIAELGLAVRHRITSLLQDGT